MANIKGAYLPALDTCRLGLFNCNSYKARYSNVGLGGVLLNSGATEDVVVPDYVFLDNFDGTGNLADHTPDIGGTWNVTEGALTLEDGFLMLGDGMVADNHTAFNDFTVADVSAEFEIYCSPSFDSGMDIQFNRQDDTNHWLIYHSPPYVQLSQRVGGILTERGLHTKSFGYTSLMLKIVTDGDNIKVYDDNVLVIDYTAVNRPLKTATAFRIHWFETSGYINFGRISAVPV